MLDCHSGAAGHLLQGLRKKLQACGRDELGLNPVFVHSQQYAEGTETTFDYDNQVTGRVSLKTSIF